MNRCRAERPSARSEFGGLEFASCYVCSPGGSGSGAAHSRLLRTLLKARDAHFLFKCASRVRQQVAERSPLTGFLSPNRMLVPVPGSSPTVAGGVTVAEQLAMALIEEGLGCGIWRGLYRAHAVRRSSTAPPGSRPSVGKHFDSFALERTLALPAQIVLVDDVITRGRTLLAAAARLREAFPETQIRAFALVRTLGFVKGVDQLLDPCVGEIRWRGGDARRSP